MPTRSSSAGTLFSRSISRQRLLLPSFFLAMV
jgi:hypothetical protein